MCNNNRRSKSATPNLNASRIGTRAVASTLPTAGQVLGWNNTTTTWEPTTSAAASGFANGGNSYGANSTVGNIDNYSLGFLTNNSTRMTIDTSGNVGIGTTSPYQPLEVNGNVRIGSQTSRTTTTNRGQLALGSTYVATVNANTTVNWGLGNIQELNTFLCDGSKTITFSNIQDGAAYTLLLSGTAVHSGLCLFSSAGYTFKASGGNVAPTVSKDVVFTFVIINTTVVYSMTDNLQ